MRAVQALRREKELAREDPLTGAANRRRLSEAVDLELMRSRRYDRPMTVAFIDLDVGQFDDRWYGPSPEAKMFCVVVGVQMAKEMLRVQLGDSRREALPPGRICQPMQIVQFQDDDAAAGKKLLRKVDENVVFGTLDIHLQQEIGLARGGLLHPILQR